MCCQHRTRTRHVAGSTGGSTIVNPWRPHTSGHIPIIGVAKGVINIAMLGLGEYFNLRMIRPQMALAAGFRLASVHYRKTVPRVTAGTASQAAVHIKTTDSSVRPCSWIKFSLFVNFQLSSMTAQATSCAFRFVIQPLIQPGVYFPYNFNGIGVLRLRVLFYFVRVTPRAVLRRYCCSDRHSVFSGSPFII